MSKPKTQLQWMVCVEGSGRKPPKCHHCSLHKFTNFSPLLLTPLECPYKNFPLYRIFSIYLPLVNGGDSMRISAPNPEIGGPKRGKFEELRTKIKSLLFSVFSLMYSLPEVLWAGKISGGVVTPSPRYWRKTSSRCQFRHETPTSAPPSDLTSKLIAL